jgi:beta-alanine degradation protein BauB
VELDTGQVRWLDAQEHQGRNVGDTASHSIFIELKEPRPTPAPQEWLGPTTF